MTARMTGDGFVRRAESAAGVAAGARRRLRADARPPRAAPAAGGAPSDAASNCSPALPPASRRAAPRAIAVRRARDGARVRLASGDAGRGVLRAPRRERRRDALRAAGARRGAIAVVAETAAPGRRGGAVAPACRTRARPWPRSPRVFYGNPSEELALVGITGTNGKTTTSYVLASIFEAAGIKCGRIGTIGYRVGARELDAARTTPEAPELQRMLRDMLYGGLRRLRHGGVVARACAQARRQPPVRRRRSSPT